MTDSQCALIIDDDDNPLGEVTLRLLRLGIDVLYSKGSDEAWLLAQQEAERISTLLFPPSVPVGAIQSILDCLRSNAIDVPRNLVVIGARPDEEQRARLRECGVRWALWEPYDESALRSVVSSAMSAKHEVETREEPRLPTTLLGRVFMGTHRKDVIVYTLSGQGAFLETPSPFLTGSKIALEMALPQQTVMAKAEVIYAKSAQEGGPPGQPNGMGVAFTKMDPGSRERLEAFLEDQDNRFAV